ncbi:fumarate hydratase class I [Salmonella enterica subsp. enterica]|uniref:Fumarate hydratase class I n=1 Tax=Salmonella enterica I TaxID=59201 RepID=A0A379WGU3_SALET|nr:fumarate hydratase class I [Salmonella enterica subsp. enterica]
MSKKEFIYQAPFPMGEDKTEYYLLTSDYVSVSEFNGESILNVEPQALRCWLSRPSMMRLLCSVLNTSSKSPPFSMTPKPAKTTNMWRCNS